MTVTVLVLGAEAALDVERQPRALGLVLGDDVRVLPGMAERAAVELAGQRADDVAHHQPHRAADGRVRAPARAEQVVAGVEVEPPRRSAR